MKVLTSHKTHRTKLDTSFRFHNSSAQFDSHRESSSIHYFFSTQRCPRKDQTGILYNIPGSVERSVLNVFNVQALHSYVKYTLDTIMDMVVNYYGQKYAVHMGINIYFTIRCLIH